MNFPRMVVLKLPIKIKISINALKPVRIVLLHFGNLLLTTTIERLVWKAVVPATVIKTT